MIRYHLFILLAALGLGTMELQAQDDRYVCIALSSGIRHCGTLVGDDGREITLETPDKGKVILPKADVLSINDAEPGTTAAAVSDNPSRVYDVGRSAQATRYLLAPSAIPLRKGEGYSHLSLSGFNVTVTPLENTMTGVYVSWFGAGATLKRSFKVSEKFWAAVGGRAVIGWGESSFGQTAGFTNVTYGDERNNLTLIGGVISSADDGDARPLLGISGSMTISSNSWIISENYIGENPFNSEYGSVYSVGIRRYKVSKNRITDIAVAAAEGASNGMIPLLWLGWTWPF